MFDVLGKYDTEERAKEILQEIVKQKAIFEFFKNVPERTQILLANDFKEDNEIFDTYEMPEKYTYDDWQLGHYIKEKNNKN